MSSDGITRSAIGWQKARRKADWVATVVRTDDDGEEKKKKGGS